MKTTLSPSRPFNTPYPLIDLEQERVEFELSFGGAEEKGVGSFASPMPGETAGLYINFSRLIGRTMKSFRIPVSQELANLIIRHPDAELGSNQAAPQYRLIAQTTTDDDFTAQDELHGV